MKLNYKILTFYMFIMAVGLFTTRIFFGIYYYESEFIKYMMPWILILAVTILIVCYTKEHFYVFDFPVKKRDGIFSVTILPIIVLMLFSLMIQIPEKQFSIKVFISCLAVGIAEEGMYRGILMDGMLKNSSANKAIVTSAMWFSLLHGLNIIGGQTLEEVIIQMMITFLSGIFLGVVYFKTKTLLLVIIYHCFWDYMIFGGMISSVEWLGGLMLVFSMIQVIVSVIVLYENDTRFRTTGIKKLKQIK